MLVVNTFFNVTFFVSRYRYGESKDLGADVLNNVIFKLLSQKQQEPYSVIDRLQPYIREFLLRDGNQPSILAYLDEMLKDLERFCAGRTKCTVPLATDNLPSHNLAYNCLEPVRMDSHMQLALQFRKISTCKLYAPISDYLEMLNLIPVCIVFLQAFST